MDNSQQGCREDLRARANTKSAAPQYELCERGVRTCLQEILRFTRSEVCSGGS